MSELIYQTLTAIGYHHPIHPAIAHLPVGLVFAGFLFSIGGVFLRQDTMAQTAQHCMMLALITLVPTILLGYVDWQQFYAGGSLFPIKMKFILAFVLLLLLVASVYLSIKSPKGIKTFVAYLLSAIAVVCLGYYGGELVFGGKSAPPATEASQPQEPAVPADVAAGSLAFGQLCSGCHYADRTDFKMGPGLRGLFQKEKLYGSEWPATDENIRKQIVAPYGTMPAYRDMSEEELDAMMAYLETL